MGIFGKSLGLEALSSTPVEGTSGTEDGATVRPPLRSDRPAVALGTALTLPAVLRAIQVISGQGAMLDLDVWRAGSKLDPVPSLAAKPDPWRSRGDWVERILVNLAGEGNAFLRKSYSLSDPTTVVALEVLDPHLVTIRRDRRNRKSYEYNGPTRRETLNAADVIHIRFLDVPGSDRGLSPIGYCRANLEGALDTRDYASDVFRSGKVSNGTLTTEQHLEQTAMKEYQRVWRNHDPRDVRVMGRGLKYEPVAINPKDAQWLESQSFSVLDVARMFGIPAPLLEAAIDGDSLTYQTLVDVNTKFLVTTLFPVYLRKVEDAVTEALPRGQRAKFNDAALLRPDARARMEIHGLAITHGVYGPAWARTDEGIPEDAARDAERKDTAPA